MCALFDGCYQPRALELSAFQTLEHQPRTPKEKTVSGICDFFKLRYESLELAMAANDFQYKRNALMGLGLPGVSLVGVIRRRLLDREGLRV